MSTGSSVEAGSDSIAVAGPGRMGIGIAQVFACAGYDVELLDVKDRTGEQWEAKRTAVTDTIRSDLSLLADEAAFDGDRDAILDRIRPTRSVEEALTGTEWLFEALPESPELKRDFSSDALAHLPDEAIVASTTSSISLDELAGPFDDPGRLVIAHWWNPPFIVPLVEVTRSEVTDDSTVSATVDLLETVGKEPVVCEDHPGFIGSRVQAAAMNEAIRAYEDGVADPTDIDRALKSGFGFRLPVLGVIEHVDLGGVDVLHHVNEYLTGAIGERFENPESVAEKVAANELGPKTGRGFYEYEGEETDPDERKREKYRGMIAIYEAVYGGSPVVADD
jgi:3-hydroxybutyryl-CoA dehydrogenase